MTIRKTKKRKRPPHILSTTINQSFNSNQSIDHEVEEKRGRDENERERVKRESKEGKGMK